MEYFINGWRYGKAYFMSFGFTRSEMDRMLAGEIVTKGENEFWINIVEK